MKLFQKLLVVSSTMSLITPLAVQASDTFNLDEMNSYSRSGSKSQRLDSETFINKVSKDIAILKGRVDGLEAQQNEIEARPLRGTPATCAQRGRHLCRNASIVKPSEQQCAAEVRVRPTRHRSRAVVPGWCLHGPDLLRGARRRDRHHAHADLPCRRATSLWLVLSTRAWSWLSLLALS